MTLLRRGKPFSLVDEKLKTQWTIHPFAWELKPNAKQIKLDWEHTDYRFVRLDDLGKYDHVPQLEVGLKRVMVSAETEKGLALLRNDHDSGAQALAVKALEVLRGFVDGDEMISFTDPNTFWQEIRWRAWHLAKNGRPSMGAAVESVLFKALATAEGHWTQDENRSITTHPIDVEKMRITINSSIEATIADRKHSLQSLAKHFVNLVESDCLSKVDVQRASLSIQFVTLSSSGSVMQCLTKLIQNSSKKALDIKLSILESRPNFEGVSFVNNLLELLDKDPNVLAKLKVEIVSDASVASVVEHANYLLIGGDKVLQDGNVSNKMGSLPAAMLAKTLSSDCRVVALFETSKIAQSDFNSGHTETEYNDASELISAWPSNERSKLEEKRSLGFDLEFKNAYFEWVPSQYIDFYISEEGALEVREIAKLSADRINLEKRLFVDL